MGVDFVHHALALYRMGEDEIATKFNMELARAARTDTESKRDTINDQYVDRHTGVTRPQFIGYWSTSCRKSSEQQLAGELEPTYRFLAKVALNEHQKPGWRRYRGTDR